MILTTTGISRIALGCVSGALAVIAVVIGIVFAGENEVVLPALKADVTFGYYGGNPGQLRMPSGLSVGPDLTIYVADAGNCRIQVFRPNGDFVRSWGTFGSRDGQFNHPLGVAVTTDGMVYVSDTGNQRVQVFSVGGDHLATWGKFGTAPGKMNYPTSLAAGPNRMVYVANTGNDRIDVFDLTGRHQFSFGGYGEEPGKFASPTQVAVDADGVLYVVDSGNQRIQVFDSDGKFVTKWGGYGMERGKFRNPTGIAIVKDRVFVVDNSNHRIQVFSKDGQSLYKWGVHPLFHEIEGRFHYPMGIAAAPSGDFLVASQPLENKVQLFKNIAKLDSIREDKAIEELALKRLSQFHYSNDEELALIQTPQGAKEILAVTQTDVQRVAVYEITDRGQKAVPKLISTFGSYGSDRGQFKMPEGVAISRNGTIFISDRENHRIQAITWEGKPAEVPRVYTAGADHLMGWGGLALDSDETLYITDPMNHQVRTISLKGEVHTWGKFGKGIGEFNLPLRVKVSERNNIVYVVDRNNVRIEAFDKKGKFLFQFGRRGSGPGEFLSPLGISVDPSGDVYVADVALHRIQRFDYRGHFKKTWGEYGNREGQMFFPTAVSVDSAKRVYVADFGNHRGQIFTGDGAFLAIFGADVFYPSDWKSPRTE